MSKHSQLAHTENKALTPPPELKTQNGFQYQVPVEGSLGLLALGYVGLMTWRQAKYNAAHQMIDSYSRSVNIPNK